MAVIAMFVATFGVLAQQSDVAQGEPFNGLILYADGRGAKARIEVVDSDKVTFSDKRGRFGLTDIASDAVLRVVLRGKELLIPVEGRRSIHITLGADNATYQAVESEEIADIGFGYVKRREKIDFSSGISGDRLRATGHSNVIDALLVYVSSLRWVNGELCLYGQASVNSSSAVLILCDGQEVNPQHINIADVESVEVLKGANIYGFRGANGVVLIKTKSAQSK